MIGKLFRLASGCLCAVAAFFIYRLAFKYPELTENIYSRRIYPAISDFLGRLTANFSFSLAEVLLYVAALAMLALLVFAFMAFIMPKGIRLYHFLKRIISLLITCSVLYSMFVFFWGLNYARQPLSQSMGLEITAYSTEDLADVCEQLIQKTKSLRRQAMEDEEGVFMLSAPKEQLFSSMSRVYDEYAPDYMNLGVKSRVKGVFASGLLSATLTTGIYSPFTFEANVNTAQPEYSLPFVAAHEYAHLKGFAREDEANFIAWYVLRNAEDADLSYSANAAALSYALNALYKVSPEDYERLYRKVDEGVKRDYAADREYWKKYRTEFAKKSNELYEDYLKSNGVEDGLQSYGRMLDLMIALHKKSGLYT